MANITDLSSEQLQRAATIKAQIEKLQKELTSIIGGNGNGKASANSAKIAGAQKGASIVPDERRAKLSAALKAHWAKRKKGANAPTAPAAKKKGPTRMSPEAIEKIRAAAKARWAAKRKADAKS